VVTRLVLDCSVTVSWCFEDESNEASTAVLESLAGGVEAIVPAHWSLEVTDALLTAERRGRLSHTKMLHFLGLLTRLPITADLETFALAFGSVAHLARDHGLTTYDAAYLELALRAGASLATFDQKLAVAAVTRGVRLVDGNNS
jgi:predicted nucleic acid-binding protein